MTYSIDLRAQVVRYVKEGGSKVSASSTFGVSRETIYRWLSSDNLAAKKHGPRHRKIDKAALLQHVRDYPDMILRERAAIFSVTTHGMWYALRALNVRKKNADLQGEEVGIKDKLSTKTT